MSEKSDDQSSPKPPSTMYRRYVLGSVYRALHKHGVPKKFRPSKFARERLNVLQYMTSEGSKSEDGFISHVGRTTNWMDTQEVPVHQFSQLCTHVHPLGEDYYSNELRFDLSVDACGALAEELMAYQDSVLDGIAAGADGTHTFESTVGAMDQLSVDIGPLEHSLSFLKHVDERQSVRDAATVACEKLSVHGVASSMRTDVYDAVQSFASSTEGKALLAKDPKERCEQARLLQRVLRDYRRKGMDLSPEVQAAVKAVDSELEQLAITYHKNLGEEDTVLRFTEAQLDGLSADQLSALGAGQDNPTTNDKGEKVYAVTLKYPDYFPVSDYCKVEETRRAMYTAFANRCHPENSELLAKIIQLRERRAQLVGYDSHGAFQLETRMSGTPQAVRSFLLDQVHQRVLKASARELGDFAKLKAAECKKEVDDVKVYWHDYRYYAKQVVLRDYAVDHLKLKEYFPLDVVTEGLLDIYSELLGLMFVENKTAHRWGERLEGSFGYDSSSEESKEDASGDKPAVTVYDVYNKDKDGKASGFVGQFYLDLFPRKGKYGHAACFGLQPGARFGMETPRYPTAALVCNFPAPTKDKPCLLPHSDVVTYFHEFGHGMHQLCSTTRYARFAGTAVESDFVECPSQMLENWCWEEDSLRRMSAHYKDHKQGIPDDLLAKLVASRNANTALVYSRQLIFAMFDQALHSRAVKEVAWAKSEGNNDGEPALRLDASVEDVYKEWAPIDVAGIYHHAQETYSPIVSTGEANMGANFGHLAGGYDSLYYGYMWSEVFSADLFNSFKQKGIFDTELGARYRNLILGRGGSVDAGDMLRDFLGRDPDADAFFKLKGLLGDDEQGKEESKVQS